MYTQSAATHARGRKVSGVRASRARDEGAQRASAVMDATVVTGKNTIVGMRCTARDASLITATATRTLRTQARTHA